VYETLGKNACQNGVSVKQFNRLYFPCPKERPDWEVELLPPVCPKSWDKFESTLDRGILRQRFTSVVQWKENSCAPDAVLFAGLHSGAAIQQVDAISVQSFLELSTSQKFFRGILCKPWGGLPIQERNQLRDQWRLQLNRERNLSSPNGMMDVNEVVEKTFAGFPCCTFTILRRAQFHCGRKVVAEEKSQSQRHSSILINIHKKHHTLQNRIQAYFNLRFNSAQRHKCSSHNCNPELHETGWLVLDRLPPLLIVSIQNRGIAITTFKDNVPVLSDIIAITHQRLHGEKIQSYAVDGAIFCVGQEQNHFVACWKGKGRQADTYLYFDSAVSPHVYAESYWTARRTPCCLRVLFLKRLPETY
jgi:hypothetical protein